MDSFSLNLHNSIFLKLIFFAELDRYGHSVTCQNFIQIEQSEVKKSACIIHSFIKFVNNRHIKLRRYFNQFCDAPEHSSFEAKPSIYIG